jgi:hypothetical protein
MKTRSLFIVALAVSFPVIWTPLAVAQSTEPTGEQAATAQEVFDREAFDQDALVTVSFGAVMMQVPVRLALQICPGTDQHELARSLTVAKGVACAIPNDAYASQPAAAERESN